MEKVAGLQQKFGLSGIFAHCLLKIFGLRRSVVERAREEPIGDVIALLRRGIEFELFGDFFSDDGQKFFPIVGVATLNQFLHVVDDDIVCAFDVPVKNSVPAQSAKIFRDFFPATLWRCFKPRGHFIFDFEREGFGRIVVVAE